MPRPEPAQPRHQPVIGKGRGQCDLQRPALLCLDQGLHGAGDGAEAFGQLRGQGRALGRQSDLPAVAEHQLHRQMRFQRAHLLGDSGMGYAQLAPGGGKAAVAGRGLERAQRGQRRNAVPHQLTC